MSSKARRLARPTRVGHPLPDVAAPTAKVFHIGADPGASIATSQLSQAEVQHSAWAPVSPPGSALGSLKSRALSSAKAAPQFQAVVSSHNRRRDVSERAAHAAKPNNAVPFSLCVRNLIDVKLPRPERVL